MHDFEQHYPMDKQPKAPYYTESLSEERYALVEAFYDHVVALSSVHGEDLTVDSILSEAESFDSDTDSEADAAICDQLSAMMSVDVQRYPRLLWSEIRVSGSGLYVQIDNDSEEGLGSRVLSLDEGESLHGTLADYRVMPIIAYGTYQQLEANGYQDDPGEAEEQPGLCMVLENVELLDSSGQPVVTHDWALVPLTYESLAFDKVIRQERGRPLFDILTSEELRTHFIIAENDLNYNEYDDEAARDRRTAHQEELRSLVQEAEERVLRVSGFATEMLTGEQRILGNDEVEYVQPTLIRSGTQWRAVHGVSLINAENGSAVPAYIVPEDIMSADWKEEEE